MKTSDTKATSTLTFIFGNCADLLPRFLDHFGTLCDHMVAVRAIGNQEPDESWKICESRGCIMGEYRNKMKHCHWPHVDDFAAARQRAADIATKRFGTHWIVWADTDDVIDTGSIERIQHAINVAAEKENVIGLLVEYSVPEDGLNVRRERIFRSDKAKWAFPIHECLDFDKTGANEMLFVEGALFLHKARPDRKSHDERNLRILESIPEEKRAIGQRFHLFQSLRALGRVDESIIVATALCQEPEIGAPEKYELLVALGQLAPDTDARFRIYLEAFGVDPTRKEAIGELALVAMATGRAKESLALTTMLRSLPRPQAYEWNARRKYGTWLGEQLHGMALRANRRTEEADAVEGNWFRRHGSVISLVHATRGRPELAWKSRRDFIDRAFNPDAIEHIFGLDYDDPTAAMLCLCRNVMVSGTGGCVEAWNAAASVATGKIIVQVSDDWIVPHGWDKMILDAIGDRIDTPAVLAISDGGRRDDLLCMSIITRERLKQQGGAMFHPDFRGVFSDNWFTDCAYRDGVVIDARDKITFEHFHPAFGKAAMDDTYMRQNSEHAYRVGSVHYERLKAGLKTSYDVDGWCNYRQFYKMLAESIPAGETFVEVGSWMGQSIIHFCQRCQDLSKTLDVVCVDTFQGEAGQEAHESVVAAAGGSLRDTFDGNIKAAGVDGMIQVIQGDSAQSALHFEEASIGGVFIDAAHDYDSVSRDLAAWFPKVRPGGFFSGHDWQWHEVRKAVEEHAEANGWKIATIGTVWFREQ